MNGFMNTLTRSSIWLHAVVLTVLVAFSFNSHAQDGEKLFRANCASCHKLDKKLVGPALAGVQDRWESEEALIAWIQNSQQYLADNPGDQYAADLFAANNNMIMPAMPLSNEDTKAILDYIANPPAPKEAGPAPGPEGAPADSGKTDRKRTLRSPAALWRAPTWHDQIWGSYPSMSIHRSRPPTLLSIT